MIKKFNLDNIIYNVLQNWFYILIFSTIITFTAGVISLQSYHPTYRTQALIAVYGKSSYGGVVYDAETTAEVFREVITSNLLQKKIAEEMKISHLPGTISCESIPYTNMITLTVTADTPQNALTTIYGILDYHSVVTDKLLADMVLQLLEEPIVPSAPIEPYNGNRTLFKAFFITAIVTILLLALAIFLRDDIKNESMVEEKLETQLLAAIYHEDKKLPLHTITQNAPKQVKGLLITNPTISFGFTETFHKLCMKLIYKTKEKKQKYIMVTSLMENEGKSTVCVNIALSLAKMGNRVLLMDLDLRKPAVYKLLELSYKDEDKEISDLLVGDATLKDCLKEMPNSKLRVLAGSRCCPNSNTLLNNDVLTNLFSQLKRRFDYIIIDTPPIEALADAETIMQVADAGILVARQNAAVARDLNDVIDMFQTSDCNLLGCVLNNIVVGITGKNYLSQNRYNDNYYHYGRYSK